MQNDDVQFDLDSEPRIAPRVETPKIIQWVIKYSFGYIKDETQANYALFSFFVAALFVIAFLLFLY